MSSSYVHKPETGVIVVQIANAKNHCLLSKFILDTVPQGYGQHACTNTTQNTH